MSKKISTDFHVFWLKLFLSDLTMILSSLFIHNCSLTYFNLPLLQNLLIIMMLFTSDVRRAFYVCYVRCTSKMWCSTKRGQKIQHFDTNWNSLSCLDQEIQSFLWQGCSNLTFGLSMIYWWNKYIYYISTLHSKLHHYYTIDNIGKCIQYWYDN